MHFHNTIEASPDQASLFDRQCNNQEELIFEIFKKQKDLLTPFDVHAYFPAWPITSVRRAISNLTQDGRLIKTNVHKQGPFGKTNYCWMVR